MNQYVPPEPPSGPINSRQLTAAAGAAAIRSWFEVLRVTHPVRGLVVIGAGDGSGWIAEWVKDAVPSLAGCPVLLVEGDEGRCGKLSRFLLELSGVSISRAVASEAGGPVEFNYFSNANENGLLSLNAVRKFWPNIDSKSSPELVESRTLDEIYRSSAPSANWLIVDALPAAAILSGGRSVLDMVDVVLARVAEGLPGQANAHLAATEDILGAHGFRRIGVQAERHPRLSRAVFVRRSDWLNPALPQSLAELRSRIEGLEMKLGVTAETGAPVSDGVPGGASGLGPESALQGAQFGSAAAPALHGQQDISAQVGAAADNMLTSLAERIEEAQRKLSGLFHREIGNALKQIEAFFSIQRFLEDGTPSLDFHGWPISPDLGAFLIKQVTDVEYDAIIEFGSGTSTVLLAKALQARSLTRPADTDARGAQGSGGLYTFEHDLAFYEGTQRLVRSHSVEAHVCLTLAPLQEWQDDTGSYRYYDADAVLGRISQEFSDGRRRRVLVLVDGPPGNACTHSRYPAVPTVFSYFRDADIDLVLDDAGRDQEQAVVELWRSYWENHGITVCDEVLPSEKGIYWARTTAGTERTPRG